MPLVRISVQEGQHKSQHAQIGDAVHRAMVETINVPPLDRFQIITEHAQADFVFDASYLNISRTNALVIIQITLNTGRTTEMKKALYKRVADLLHQPRCITIRQRTNQRRIDKSKDCHIGRNAQHQRDQRNRGESR